MHDYHQQGIEDWFEISCNKRIKQAPGRLLQYKVSHLSWDCMLHSVKRKPRTGWQESMLYIQFYKFFLNRMWHIFSLYGFHLVIQINLTCNIYLNIHLVNITTSEGQDLFQGFYFLFSSFGCFMKGGLWYVYILFSYKCEWLIFLRCSAFLN